MFRGREKDGNGGGAAHYYVLTALTKVNVRTPFISLFISCYKQFHCGPPAYQAMRNIQVYTKLWSTIT